MDARRFGWLPLRIEARGANWAIKTLSHFEEAVKNVLASEQVDKEWYWPDIVTGPPARPTAAYHLPVTHEMRVELPAASDEPKFAEFLICVLGFLYGMLLTPEGWVQFNRVSIDPHRWQDFGMTDEARTRILEKAARTWIANPSLRDDLFGIVWWHTYAVAYDQPFERFMAQYQVLDACWSVHKKINAPGRTDHAARIGALAKFYNMQAPPNWSLARENQAIADIRNNVIHEAKWGGEAIGFGHPAKPNEGIHLELYWFNSRLILALLGEENSYIHGRIVYQPYLIK